MPEKKPDVKNTETLQNVQTSQRGKVRMRDAIAGFANDVKKNNPLRFRRARLMSCNDDNPPQKK